MQIAPKGNRGIAGNGSCGSRGLDLPDHEGNAFAQGMNKLTIQSPEPAHKADWARLYRGYAIFYKREPDEAVIERLWHWISDPAHPFKALVALDEGKPVGLAHYRPDLRPAFAEEGCFLDDLFVDPDCRRGGVGGALIQAVADVARQRGWKLVRWRTADDNYRARTLYDRHATRTMWITYDLTP